METIRLIDFNDCDDYAFAHFLKTIQDTPELYGDAVIGELSPTEVAKQMLRSGRVFGNVLVTADDKVAGAFIGIFASHWFNPKTKYFKEMLLFILPEYRKPRTFLRLYNSVEDLARSYGSVGMQIGNSTNTYKQFGTIMNKLGYKSEPYYVKQF